MMPRSKYSPIPNNVLFSLGGFTLVRPEEWRRYLDSAIRINHPQYYMKYTLLNREDRQWMVNDCILAALDHYMFFEFGLILPQDNLFKVYNPQGEGLLPDQIINAITAVIEPFGFEVDKVLVPDAELRSGLKHPDKVTDLSQAEQFDGKAGIAMINIENGYSHAFFWKQMEKNKFSSEQFRMAVLVKRKDGSQGPARSAIKSLDGYFQLVREYLSGKSAVFQQLSAKFLAQVEDEIACLYQFVHDPEERHDRDYRARIDEKLASILLLLEQGVKKNKAATEDGYILETGQAVRRIFQEAETIG